MTSAANKWKTFWSLNATERSVTRSAAAGLAFTWIGLRAFGFSRWQQMLARRFSPVQMKNSTGPTVSAKRIAQLQEAAALTLFLPTTCLERSLALWSLLQRRGFPAELKLGARMQSEKFEAHAWVQLNGVALDNPLEEQREFAPFEPAIASQETRAK